MPEDEVLHTVKVATISKNNSQVLVIKWHPLKMCFTVSPHFLMSINTNGI